MSAAAVAPSPPAPLPSTSPPSYPAAPSAPSAEDDNDLYGRVKSLQRHMEFVEIQSVPLVIGQFMEMVDGNNGIVGSTTGSNYYVRILSTINRELLKPSASVALHRHSNALVDVLPPEADSSISLLASSRSPTSSTRGRGSDAGAVHGSEDHHVVWAGRSWDGPNAATLPLMLALHVSSQASGQRSWKKHSSSSLELVLGVMKPM